jgi:hypothetical protein
MTTPEEQYPMGATVTFADVNATVSDDVLGLREGLINGAPLTDDDNVVLYVPVFTDRDNGREATTIYVAVANIADVKPTNNDRA